MLQMHTNTINLTMQALQSRSLARLERAVIPIAENINSIHERVNGDLGDKIDDLHRIIMSIANSTPSLVARDRSLEGVRPLSRESIPALDAGDGSPPRLLVAPPPRGAFAPVRQTILPDRSPASPRDSVQSTPIASRRYAKTEGRRAVSMDWNFENGSPPDGRNSIGDTLVHNLDWQSDPNYLTASSSTSTGRESTLARRESSTLPHLFNPIDEDVEEHATAGSSIPLRYRQQSHENAFSPISERRSESWRSSNSQPILPPPAIAPACQQPLSPATPSSVFSQDQRSQSDSNVGSRPSRPPTAKSQKAEPSPALATLPAFEKALFRNAAILCDVRGTLVEYAQHLPDEPDPRYNTEMVETCKDARICVIRKRENREHGGTQLATSIWTLSEDGIVRCQQKLSESETVPYNSYFQPEKVSLADGVMSLRYHGQSWSDMPEKDIRTHWVNYILKTEKDSVAFQSAVFGRMLVGTFRTTKTTVLHPGIKGTFAFEEQFANIETLRLWEDDGIATPGAQGGVMALLHISSTFGEGWARWWMNSSKQQVKTKGEGTKHVRIKGIDITVVKPGAVISATEKVRQGSISAGSTLQRAATKESLSPVQAPMKRFPVKRVTGIKVEFKEEADRGRFVEACLRLQERVLLPLPDL